MPRQDFNIERDAEIVKLAATTDLTHAEIGQQYSLSTRRVGQIITKYAMEIDRANREAVTLALKFATADNVYNQAWRMKERMRDMIKLDADFTSDAVRTREAIRANIAKEIGEIAPARQYVSGTVSHIIGIDRDRWYASQIQSPKNSLEVGAEPVLTESENGESSPGLKAISSGA